MGSCEDQASVKSEDSPVPRVKFLCSYGGRILPRPQDDHLRYVGGETRMVAVNRNVTYAELVAKLQSFFGPNLRFKYQLPSEDLDALISVTCDEDVENMMDEYDKNESREGSARLRAFLFPPPSSTRSFFQDFIDDPKSPDRKYVEALNNDTVRVKVPNDPSYSGAFQVPPDFLFGLDPANRQPQNYQRQQHHDSEVTSPTYLRSPVIEPSSPSRYHRDTPSVTSFAPPVVVISQAEFLNGPAPPHSTPALVPLVSNLGRHAWDAKKAWDGGSGEEHRGEWREERRSGDLANDVNYTASQQHRESGPEPGLRRISSKDRLAVHPLDGSFPDAYVVIDRHLPKIQKQPVHTSVLVSAERQRSDDVQIDASGHPEIRQEMAVASGGRPQRNVEVYRVVQQANFGAQGYEGTGELPPGNRRNSADSEFYTADSDVRIENQVVDSVLNKGPIGDSQGEGFRYQDNTAYAVEETTILQQQKQADFEVSIPHPSHQIEVPQHMHLGKGHFQQVHWQTRESVDQQQQQMLPFDAPRGHNAAAPLRVIPSHSSQYPLSGAAMHHHRLPSAAVNTGKVVTRVEPLPNTRAPSPLYRQAGNQVLVRTEQQLTRAISPLRDNPSANGPLPQRYAARMVQVHESARVIHPTTVQQASGFPVSPAFVDFSEPHAIYDQTHYAEKATKGNSDTATGQIQYSNKIVPPDHDQTLGQANYVEDNLKASAQYVRGTNFQDNYVEDNLKANPQYVRVTSFQDSQVIHSEGFHPH